MNNMSFYKVRFNSWNIFPFMILSFLACVFCTVVTWKNRTEIPNGGILCFLLIDFIMAFFFLWSFSAKIEINKEGVLSKSMLKTTFLKWSEIRTCGVFVLGSNIKYLIPKERYDKFILGGTKFLYLCDADFKPGVFKLKPRKGYLDFHYRKEAFDMIQDYLKACENPNFTLN